MDPFIAEIRPFAFGRAPKGWMPCEGQLLPVSAYSALFALLGTTYGGNGMTNFKLPDLRGRTPIHRVTADAPLGIADGSETVTLVAETIPAHAHAVWANTGEGTDIPPANDFFAGTSGGNHRAYGEDSKPVALNAATLDASGHSVPHTNMQPYQVIGYCIAVEGIFPSRE